MPKTTFTRSLALASVATALLALPAAGQTENILHSFAKTSRDGNTPLSHILFSKNVLYGTTEKGGAYKFGTVFQLKKTNGVWRETVLYNFPGGIDGAFPKAGVLSDASGALYGTTERGGSKDDGTVFRLYRTGNGWDEQVIHSFTAGSDGSHPVADLKQDPTSGIFYGTTYTGGSARAFSDLSESSGIPKETRV
jgi:uncharacterized repeat protein (TIGR03803 family)